MAAVVTTNISLVTTRLLCAFRQRKPASVFGWDAIAASTRCCFFSKSDTCLNLKRMGAGKSSCKNSSAQGVAGTHWQKAGDGSIGDDNFVTASVCSESDMRDGEMKEFPVGWENQKVLVVKQNGQYCAFGAKCTHYGANLSKGTFVNGEIRCPWHGACFNSLSGDIEDYPGMDSLPKHQVDIRDGKVVVTADKSLLKSNKRRRAVKKDFPSCDTSDSKKIEETFLIIGGGGAGSTCVEELRYQGFAGKIIMATQESFVPYDRPKLSKALDSSGDKLALRSQEFYDSLGIQILFSKKAVELNATSKKVKFSDDSEIEYDKLLLATGGTPRKHTCPGSDLNNIFYLRSPLDANKIAEAAKDKDLTVIGNSFIGMEVAAYFAQKAKSVSVLSRCDTPFKYSLGPEIGAHIKKWFESKGIEFYGGRTIEKFIGDDNGDLKSLQLDDGTSLPTQVCVVGIGVVPETSYVTNSGIELNDKQQIVVDKFLQTSDSDVFAAGDIVSFPLTTYNDERVNIGHWQLALYHGKIAACNILGKNMAVNTVPFFWCMMFGKSIRFAGYNHGYDDIYVDGSLDDFTFAIYYFKGDFAVAAATVGMDPTCSYFAAFLKSGKKLTKDEIRSNPKGWIPSS